MVGGRRSEEMGRRRNRVTAGRRRSRERSCRSERIESGGIRRRMVYGRRSWRIRVDAWGAEDGGAVIGVGGAAGTGVLQVRVGGAVEVRRSRSGSRGSGGGRCGGGGGGLSSWRNRLLLDRVNSSGGGSSCSRRGGRRPVGGVRVLPANLITGDKAVVNQQRKFWNRRLNSPGLEHNNNNNMKL